MSSPVISENMFLLYSLLMGIIMTFVYDIFRICRRVHAHSLFLISLEDIIFWIITAISVFYLMHTQSNGTLRWFAILGALTGMFLYKKTASPFFVKWVSFVLSKLFGTLHKVLVIIGKPFGFCAKKGKKAGETAVCGARHMKGFVKKRLTTLLKMLKIVLCKQ